MQDPFGYNPGNYSGNDTKTDAYLKKQQDIELLKSYKELLDCGIITQAEFDAKKRELLSKDYQKPQQQSQQQSQPPRTSPPSPEPSPFDHTAWQQPQQQYDDLFRQPPVVVPTYVPEYEAPHICPKCGKTVPPSEDSCPFCEIRENAAETAKLTRRYSMKWNKFVCILLLLSGILYILNAVLSLLVLTMGVSASSGSYVLGMLGLVQLVFSIIMIILSFSTRSALEWNKKKGPKLWFVYMNVDLICMGLGILIFLLFGAGDVVDFVMDAVYNPSWIIELMVANMEAVIIALAVLGVYAVIKLAVNVPQIVYYVKRRHIFIY